MFSIPRLLVLLFAFTACARPTAENSKVRLVVPKLRQKVAPTLETLSIPSSVNSVGDINCFAIMVGGPEDFFERNRCKLDTSEGLQKVMKFGPWFALVGKGEEILIDIPSGRDRIFHLFGGKAAAGECKDLRTQSGLPNISKLRHLAAQRADLQPGPQDVILSIPTQISLLDELDPQNCEIQGQNTSSNSPPAITESCESSATSWVPYSCHPQVVDPDFGNIHTWSLGSAHTCGWAVIDSQTGLITGTPGSSDVGSCMLSFQVSDGMDSSSEQSIPITVEAFALSQMAYAKASNSDSGDQFGAAVDISGDFAVVGAWAEKSTQTTITNGSVASSDNSATGAGAAYVLAYDSTVGWVQEAYLKASNAEANDNFGNQVAISGQTIAVAAEYEDSNQSTITNGSGSSPHNSTNDGGAVYVFVKEAGLWKQEAYLKAPNVDASDAFGRSLAIDGDTIVVGVPEEDNSQTTITNGSSITEAGLATATGAAYVFRRNAGAWIHEAYLKAPNAEGGDRFGHDVGISGDTIIVGAPYEDSAQSYITNGGPITADDSSTTAGAAYVFVRSGTNWAFQSYLKAPNTNAYDQFGYSVALDKDTAVVGANFEDSADFTVTNGTAASSDNTANEAGAAYVFVRSGTDWSPQAYLKPPNIFGNLQFGTPVDISNDLIVVGAYKDKSNSTTTTNDGTASNNTSALNTGAAYLFVREGNLWQFVSYMKAPNAESDDKFGRAAAVDGGRVIIGAPDEDSNNNSIMNGSTASGNNSNGGSGAAYIFE